MLMLRTMLPIAALFLSPVAVSAADLAVTYRVIESSQEGDFVRGRIVLEVSNTSDQPLQNINLKLEDDASGAIAQLGALDPQTNAVAIVDFLLNEDPGVSALPQLWTATYSSAAESNQQATVAAELAE